VILQLWHCSTVHRPDFWYVVTIALYRPVYPKWGPYSAYPTSRRIGCLHGWYSRPLFGTGSISTCSDMRQRAHNGSNCLYLDRSMGWWRENMRISGATAQALSALMLQQCHWSERPTFGPVRAHDLGKAWNLDIRAHSDCERSLVSCIPLETTSFAVTHYEAGLAGTLVDDRCHAVSGPETIFLV
jgi:hypothetical protein